MGEGRDHRQAGLDQGSTHAAVTATGAHGVRRQYDYTHDAAGRPGRPTDAAPQWLRLTRTDATHARLLPVLVVLTVAVGAATTGAVLGLPFVLPA
ncbi:hypothetical protein [Kitasatospora phosalacinea]|uniref:Uncharacterized protein n=1 Tax=Kitasatospora phosalacinea TaxID=2065 RepID=A0ABW6GFQ4_9ACTN